jgi:ABC-type multidrug transport system permease subunit
MALPMVVVPFFTGAAVTLGCGGAGLQKRIVSVAIAGVLMGILATGTSVFLGTVQTGVMHLLAGFVWRVFLCALFASISAMLTEVFFPDRDGVR